MSHKSELTEIFRNNFEGIDEEAEAMYITELLDYINKLVKSTSSVVKAEECQEKHSFCGQPLEHMIDNLLHLIIFFTCFYLFLTTTC